MKYILKLLLVLLMISNGEAQETKTLLSQELVSDLSHTPIYPRLIEEEDGVKKWKTKYAYIDSIDLYRISYLSDGLKVRGLMVKPKKAGNYPCIIINRGGNRDFGSLKIAQGIFWLGQIAKEGYIVIASQYRGNEGGEGKEEFGGKDVNDVLNLVDVLEEVEGADTSKIGMYGWSRGGMMTYIALTQSNRIKAAVVGGAVSDNFRMVADRPEMESGVLAELVPDYDKNKEEELRKRSAVHWADKFPKDVPILMLHGNADWRVKPEHSLSMALEFEKHRVPYRLIIFEGGDHGIREHKKEVNEQVLAWFDRYLKQEEALPKMEYHGR